MSNEEIVQALQRINDNKSPGCDGFNAYFFKKAWEIVGEEIIEAVQEFFVTGKLHKAINCTTVTLIPKVKHLQKYQSIDLSLLVLLYTKSF